VDRHRRRAGRRTHAAALLAGLRLRSAADPAVRQVVAKAGSPIEYLDAPDFQNYWDQDAASMVQAVRRIGKLE
jgi:hypothetical protein